jgi:enoyl-[acyl-carrier protein] reductase II
VHENFKGAIVNGSEQGTYILNKKSKPCIRALKTDLTEKIYEEGQMDMSALGGIKDLYFGGDMNAAPALAGQSIGLINKVMPVEEIIKQTMQEFNTVCDTLTNSKFEL